VSQRGKSRRTLIAPSASSKSGFSTTTASASPTYFRAMLIAPTKQQSAPNANSFQLSIGIDWHRFMIGQKFRGLDGHVDVCAVVVAYNSACDIEALVKSLRDN
jgi:hypothetical protein